MIAARDTSPPMSIGLFGDWGTGKSFFMSLMDREIRALKEVARATRTSAYCPNIVQLHFNAWHYIDTDLWASLTAEIFDGLAAALRDEAALDGGKDAQAERARLLAATTYLRGARTETERRKAEADPGSGRTIRPAPTSPIGRSTLRATRSSRGECSPREKTCRGGSRADPTATDAGFGCALPKAGPSAGAGECLERSPWPATAPVPRHGRHPPHIARETLAITLVAQ